MNVDARARLEELVKRKARQSQAAQVRDLKPVIDAAREAGATWGEVADAVGVPKPSLLAALAPPRRALQQREAAPAQKAPRMASDERITNSSGVTRWQAKKTSDS